MNGLLYTVEPVSNDDVTFNQDCPNHIERYRKMYLCNRHSYYFFPYKTPIEINYSAIIVFLIIIAL